MYCERFGPNDLLPRADLLAFFLMNEAHVTGVAITGSLARLERWCHDIDLVVLHDGALEDGSCSDPDTKINYGDRVPLTSFSLPEIAYHLTQARNGVPIDYLCINERILWDCDYLRSCADIEEYSEFYLQIFSEPLILLNPNHRRGELRKHTTRREIFSLKCGFPHLSPWNLYGMQISHECKNQGCKPIQPWEQCRDKIRRRKNHHWHE
ncbi:MAG: hypothetical protein A3C07_00955 [Candidatus Sungbacteria bacterium RIFCSPHIGHO2_02_FULL_47_11]|uniref:Uncharacterized protein n=1 Tax=Candidatus Sungbacteria bacterium RIFCSPHIGHO2_02_FULL_47_11 TaxID=1802270 RepID=A0A1G2KNV7_9BACT|nr:MAG: hypothetical protein A3C07_00955 [Candidatus Sungbacteria bacterium RIFCSPHIGHO2_02_FULL_47_11]